VRQLAGTDQRAALVFAIRADRIDIHVALIGHCFVEAERQPLAIRAPSGIHFGIFAGGQSLLLAAVCRTKEQKNRCAFMPRERQPGSIGRPRRPLLQMPIGRQPNHLRLRGT
jgi:hypothetical protein